MKMLLVLFTLPTLAFAQAYFPFTKNVAKGGYEFRFEGAAHQTEKTYDENGNTVELDEGESYEIKDLDLYATYGYSRELQFRFGAKFRQVDSVELGPNDTNLYSLSESGVHSGYAEIRYAWPRIDNIYYTFELGYRHNSYTNKPYDSGAPNDFIVLGNDGQDFHIGLNITMQPKMSAHFISSKLFYRSPGSNMSSEFFYQLEAAAVWKHLALLAGVVGVESLNNDQYSGDSANKPVLPNGASSFFNGIDRNFTDAYAGAVIAFNHKVKIEAKAGMTMRGNNTDKRKFALVNLVLRNDNPKNVNVASQSFKNYSIDGDIIRVSPNGTYVVVNKGLADGVTKGMRFDFYEDDFLGGSKLLAAGLVVKLGASSCIVQIGRYYGVEKIREGYSARAGQ